MAWNSVMRVLGGLFILLTLSAPVSAERLYKWVDQYGNVSYQDKPPPEGSGRVEEKKVRLGPSSAGGELGGKGPVTLYSAPKCRECDIARLHLKQRKVPFSEIDVSEKNPEAQQEMIKKVGALLIPTLTVGSKVMKGYMESLLDGELDSAGYPKSPEKAAAAAAAEAAENAAK